MYRILLVEDDEQIREVITDYFSAQNGAVLIETAADGNEGLDCISENNYDLIMLDVMLPGIDGYSLCREIRSKSIVPVMFLTARGRENDVLYGYSLGCDDYIVKPFSLAELYAKTTAMLKRASGTIMVNELVCGKITLNPLSQSVTSDGKPVELAPKEYAILRYLIEHRDWVTDRNTLLDKIWGYDYEGGDRIVDNHIKKLRKALGDAGSQIKTVFARGYKITERGKD